jgi:antitoxin HigA-1
MRRLSKHRRPIQPGEVFLEDFLEPLGITQKEAAERLRISYPRMNEIVKGRRGVTPDTALRLARFTGTEPEFWQKLQQAVDLWDAMHSEQAAELDEIQPARNWPLPTGLISELSPSSRIRAFSRPGQERNLESAPSPIRHTGFWR